jgi:hypothetical protein
LRGLSVKIKSSFCKKYMRERMCRVYEVPVL